MAMSEAREIKQVGKTKDTKGEMSTRSSFGKSFQPPVVLSSNGTSLPSTVMLTLTLQGISLQMGMVAA